MDDIGTMARPYAVAAFKQAQEEGQVEQWAGMLSLLVLICADATMKGLIASPKVNRTELEKLILDICGDRLSETGRNFARVLVEKGRLPLVADIERQFAAERAKMEGRRAVRVISAYALSDAQRDDIATKIAKRLGSDVELEVEVDPKLIGGVIVRAGDMVIDASLRGRLAQLGQAIR